MKILKKSLALFLVVTLFASMSITAFAKSVSDYASGVKDKKTWSASYTITDGQRANGTMTWYGPGTVSIESSTHQRKTTTNQYGDSILRFDGGSGSASIRVNSPKSGYYLSDGSMLVFIRSTPVETLNVTYRR